MTDRDKRLDEVIDEINRHIFEQMSIPWGEFHTQTSTKPPPETMERGKVEIDLGKDEYHEHKPMRPFLPVVARKDRIMRDDDVV